jgi:hypothetical protein
MIVELPCALGACAAVPQVMTAIFDTDGTVQNVPASKRMEGFGNEAGPAPPQSFGAGGGHLSNSGGYTVGGSSSYGGGTFSSPGAGSFASGGGRFEGYGNPSFPSQGSKPPVSAGGAVAGAAAGAALKGLEIAKDLGGKGLAAAAGAVVTAMPIAGKMAGVVAGKYNEVQPCHATPPACASVRRSGRRFGCSSTR